jgi:hypothetical protein
MHGSGKDDLSAGGAAGSSASSSSGNPLQANDQILKDFFDWLKSTKGAQLKKPEDIWALYKLIQESVDEYLAINDESLTQEAKVLLAILKKPNPIPLNADFTSQDILKVLFEVHMPILLCRKYLTSDECLVPRLKSLQKLHYKNRNVELSEAANETDFSNKLGKNEYRRGKRSSFYQPMQELLKDGGKLDKYKAARVAIGFVEQLKKDLLMFLGDAKVKQQLSKMDLTHGKVVHFLCEAYSSVIFSSYFAMVLRENKSKDQVAVLMTAYELVEGMLRTPITREHVVIEKGKSIADVVEEWCESIQSEVSLELVTRSLSDSEAKKQNEIQLFNLMEAAAGDYRGDNLPAIPVHEYNELKRNRGRYAFSDKCFLGDEEATSTNDRLKQFIENNIDFLAEIDFERAGPELSDVILKRLFLRFTEDPRCTDQVKAYYELVEEKLNYNNKDFRSSLDDAIESKFRRGIRDLYKTTVVSPEVGGSPQSAGGGIQNNEDDEDEGEGEELSQEREKLDQAKKSTRAALKALLLVKMYPRLLTKAVKGKKLRLNKLLKDKTEKGVLLVAHELEVGCNVDHVLAYYAEQKEALQKAPSIKGRSEAIRLVLPLLLGKVKALDGVSRLHENSGLDTCLVPAKLDRLFAGLEGRLLICPSVELELLTTLHGALSMIIQDMRNLFPDASVLLAAESNIQFPDNVTQTQKKNMMVLHLLNAYLNPLFERFKDNGPIHNQLLVMMNKLVNDSLSLQEGGLTTSEDIYQSFQNRSDSRVKIIILRDRDQNERLAQGRYGSLGVVSSNEAPLVKVKIKNQIAEQSAVLNPYLYQEKFKVTKDEIVNAALSALKASKDNSAAKELAKQFMVESANKRSLDVFDDVFKAVFSDGRSQYLDAVREAILREFVGAYQAETDLRVKAALAAQLGKFVPEEDVERVGASRALFLGDALAFAAQMNDHAVVGEVSRNLVLSSAADSASGASLAAGGSAASSSSSSSGPGASLVAPASALSSSSEVEVYFTDSQIIKLITSRINRCGKFKDKEALLAILNNAELPLHQRLYIIGRFANGKTSRKQGDLDRFVDGSKVRGFYYQLSQLHSYPMRDDESPLEKKSDVIAAFSHFLRVSQLVPQGVQNAEYYVQEHKQTKLTLGDNNYSLNNDPMLLLKEAGTYNSERDCRHEAIVKVVNDNARDDGKFLKQFKARVVLARKHGVALDPENLMSINVLPTKLLPDTPWHLKVYFRKLLKGIDFKQGDGKFNKALLNALGVFLAQYDPQGAEKLVLLQSDGMLDCILREPAFYRLDLTAEGMRITDPKVGVAQVLEAEDEADHGYFKTENVPNEATGKVEAVSKEVKVKGGKARVQDFIAQFGPAAQLQLWEALKREKLESWLDAPKEVDQQAAVFAASSSSADATPPVSTLSEIFTVLKRAPNVYSPRLHSGPAEGIMQILALEKKTMPDLGKLAEMKAIVDLRYKRTGVNRSSDTTGEVYKAIQLYFSEDNKAGQEPLNALLATLRGVYPDNRGASRSLSSGAGA